MCLKLNTQIIFVTKQKTKEKKRLLIDLIKHFATQNILKKFFFYLKHNIRYIANEKKNEMYKKNEKKIESVFN